MVGAAGAGREPEREELREGAPRGKPGRPSVVVTTDIEIALAGGVQRRARHRGERGHRQHRGGTGHEAGKRHRIGGYGWQMGDEGSGYAIGRAALGAVSRATTPEARRPRSATGCSPPPGARTSTRWSAGRPPRHPRKWRRSRRTCSSVAAEGDQLAQGIADYAARELSQLAICLLPKMDAHPAGSAWR